MTFSAAHPLVRAVALVFTALPFAFAAVRVATTGTDFRYFWVAAGSAVGAAVAMVIGRSLSRRAPGVLPLTTAAFVAATVGATLAASWLGTSINTGMMIVAAAFGFCNAVGSVLLVPAQQ